MTTTIPSNTTPPITTKFYPNRNVHQWARYYADSGLLPILIDPESKKPSGKWKSNLIPHDNVLSIHGNSNVGVRMGGIGNNLCDIDLDHENARRSAPYFLPQTATFGRVTSPVSHYIYFLDFTDNPDSAQDSWMSQNRIAGMETVCEFRYGDYNPKNEYEGKTKAVQTIFPSSIHADTKELIQWTDQTTSDPISKVPRVQASYLKRQYYKMAAMSVLIDVIQPGWFHHSTVFLAGILHHLNWELGEAEEFILALCDLTDMQDTEDRLKTLYDSYCEDVEKHIGGFNELKNVLNNASLDGDMIIRYLRNTLGQTGLGKAAPMSPRDVFNKLSLSTQTRLENKFKLSVPPVDIMPPITGMGQEVLDPSTNQPINTPDQNNQIDPTIPGSTLITGKGVNQSQSGMEQLESFDSNDVKRSLLAPLQSPYTENYLIEGLLPEAEVGIVVGESGSYKSYMLVDMAMSMMYKLEWAGKAIHEDCGDILWCAGEGSKNLTGRIEMWKQENLQGGEIPRADFLFYDKWLDLFTDPKIDQTTSPMEYLGKFLQQQSQIKTVILDTWSSLYSGDENSNSDTARTLKSLNHMAVTFGVTFVIVHHKGKDGNSYRGASALIANSDFNFDISKEYLVTSSNEKITKDTPTSGRIIFEDRQQRSGESNTKIYFRPKVGDLHGMVNNFGTQLKNLVMVQEMEHQTSNGVNNIVGHSKYTTGKYGINSLVDSQRDTFNYVQEIIFNKIGSGSVGMCLVDLYNDSVEFRAFRGQKSPGREDGFGRKIDGLVQSRVLIKTRKSGEEWLQIGEDRYVDPDYRDSICPVKPKEMRMDDVGSVFSKIPMTPEPMSIHYDFLD